MFHQPYQILINNVPTELGGYLPSTITSFKVHLFMNMQIPSQQSPALKQWLNTIIDRLDCEYVSFNDTLIPASELTKF